MTTAADIDRLLDECQIAKEERQTHDQIMKAMAGLDPDKVRAVAIDMAVEQAKRGSVSG